MNSDFEPVRANLGQQVFQHLRDKIYQMEFEPGAKLGVGEIAEQLNVSRSPVRDAIMMLIAEGVVLPVQSGGYKVIEFDRKYINDVFVIRLALEPTAVQLAVENLDRRKLEVLRETWLQLRAADEATVHFLELHVRADNDLHQQIAELSLNPLLKEAIARTISLAAMIRRWQYTGGGNYQHLSITTEEHLVMLDAMLRRDVEASVTAMQAHLRNSHQRSLIRLDNVMPEVLTEQVNVKTKRRRLKNEKA